MTERTNEECNKFAYEKLCPAVHNLDAFSNTPAKLRYIRDEISLFLGDPINAVELLEACEELSGALKEWTVMYPGLCSSLDRHAAKKATSAIANAKVQEIE